VRWSGFFFSFYNFPSFSSFFVCRQRVRGRGFFFSLYNFPFSFFLFLVQAARTWARIFGLARKKHMQTQFQYDFSCPFIIFLFFLPFFGAGSADVGADFWACSKEIHGGSIFEGGRVGLCCQSFESCEKNV
jgi:hypothetical protein